MKRSKIRHQFLLVLCMSFAVWLACSPSTLQAANSAEQADKAMGHSSAEEVVVAKVNGQEINMAQLMRAMSEVSEKKYLKQEVSPLLAEKIKQEATDKLIIEELAFQRAAASIKTVPAELLEAKMQAVRKKYKSEAEFEKYANEFGGVSGLRKQLERFLTLETFIGQEFGAKITVSDDEVRKAYDEAKSQAFVKDEFVQVNDLIFFLDPTDPKATAKIEKIKQTIQDQHGNDPSKFPNGEGVFSMEKNKPLDKIKDKALFEAAKGLKEFGWSAPVDVDGNLHIVQLVGYKPAVNKSLQDVTPYLKNEILKTKRQALLNDWMAGLKNGATIEIMDLTR